MIQAIPRFLTVASIPPPVCECLPTTCALHRTGTAYAQGLVSIYPASPSAPSQGPGPSQPGAAVAGLRGGPDRWRLRCRASTGGGSVSGLLPAPGLRRRQPRDPRRQAPPGPAQVLNRNSRTRVSKSLVCILKLRLKVLAVVLFVA